MKLVDLLFIGLLGAASMSCRHEVSRADFWQEADKPIEQYRLLHENKTIIVYMSADWDLTGRVVVDALQEGWLLRKIRKKDVVTLVYDCTERDSIGTTESRKLGPAGAPDVLVVFHGNTTKPAFYRPVHKPDGVGHSAQEIVDKILAGE